MKITKIIFLSFLAMSCKKEIDNKSISNIEKSDTLNTKTQPKIVENDKIIEIGYVETFEKLPKLVFESISEKDFNKIKSNIFIEKYKADEKENHFFVKTDHKTFSFKKYNYYKEDDSHNGFELLGFYKNLNLFALTDNTSSEGLDFGTLFFIDKTNDYQYKIVSFGDGSVELPIPSPNNKFMVYYYNGVYQHKNCEIGLLKINDKTNPKKYFLEYSYYESNDFAIEKIIWKSDNCFYVKGYEEIYENENWIKKYKFYMTEFK